MDLVFIASIVVLLLAAVALVGGCARLERRK
jgi:hypothetical protein